MFKTHSKGFNLFSAIVAAGLFLAGIMLVQTMVSTEDRLSGQIFSMESNFALSDAANLARSDAIQTFNYHFREKLETYLSNKDNSFPILYRNLDGKQNYKDWSLIVNEFEKQILRVNENNQDKSFGAVILLVSEKMLTDFNPGQYGRYSVSLDKPVNQNNINKLSQTIENSLQSSINEGDPFLEVVDCDLEENIDCPLGTFYFNIPLNKISDKEYEELPRIIVKDLITSEEIKIAILPRSKLRIYIPLRFFKAIQLASLHYSNAVSQNHDTFADYRLGYCDNGCNPRNNPLGILTGNRNLDCLGTSTNQSSGIVNLSNSPAGLNSYSLGGTSTGSLGLKANAVQKICLTGATSTGSTDNDFININHQDPDPDKQGLPPNNNEIQVKITNCPFSKITVLTNTYRSKRLIVSAGNTNTEYLHCGYIASVIATTVFKETNENYIVKGKTNEYRISIIDEDFSKQPDSLNEGCKTGDGKCTVAN
jgi:hypothetical protein